MTDEPWLRAWEERLRPSVHGSGIAFDIGANAGTWTRVLRNLYGSVVSVEPDPRCVPPFGHEYDRRVVASKSGETAVLYLRENALQNSLSHYHAVGNSGEPVHVVSKMSVETVTIDDLASKYGEPEFVKMDIEGGEVDALVGATLPCFAKCKWLIELHDTRHGVCVELARIGFETVSIMKHPNPDAGAGHEWLFAEKSK